MVRKSNLKYKEKASMYKGMFALLLVLIIAFGLFSYYGNMSFSVAGDSQTEKIVETLTTSDYCSNNPTKSLNLRLKDMLSTTGAYLNGSTVYVTDVGTGSTVEYTITGGTTGAFTTVASNLKCGGAGYEVLVKGTGTQSSDGLIVITAEDLNKKVTTLEYTVEGTSYTPFKVKAYDEDGRGDLYNSANSTAYQTVIGPTFYYGTGSTAFTVATDGMLDITFTFAPNTSGSTKGEAMYLAFNIADDSNIDDWEEDSLSVVYDGVQLVEATDLSANEIKALSSYEKIYRVENPIGMKGGLKDTEVDMRVTVSSGSGINPDFDPVIKVVALGDYKSTMTDDVLENIGFQDGTSRTELYTAQTITIAVD